MEAKIMICNDDVKKVVKSTTLLGTARPIHPTGIVSRDNPVLIIDYNSAFTTANYMQIEEYGRYYFITVSVDIAGKMIISGSVDPLMSFADTLINCPVTVVRNESIGVNRVADTQLPVDPEIMLRSSIRLSNNLFNTEAVEPYVLTVMGG